MTSSPAEPPAHTGALSARDDEALMALCHDGHVAAFAVLVERHEVRIVGLAAKYLGDRHLAEEACQAAFVRLWQLRERYEPRGRLSSYLSMLCINACRDLSRAMRRRVRALQRLSAEGSAATGESEPRALADERRRAIEQAVAALPAKLREAVLLRFFADLSYAEMSGLLGQSEVTLRSRVHHGLKRLRDLLSENAP